MKSILRIIFAPLRWFCYALIYIYKYTLSKIIPDCCIYHPTCSTYTLIAIKRFGIIKGCFLGAKRILRCRPKFKGGLDVVPDNLKTNLMFKI
ncbi:MAG: membrane protein insertion efficiency factor YidD [Clostridia bacterium]|nr:membrane protein insertion efficiency factor YidD [Clostridia bacterium]